MALLLHLNEAYSEESAYPTGSSVQYGYSLSSVTLAVDDTLNIQRTVINNEAFVLTGLYFSDNLPPEFELVDDAIRVNGSDLIYTHFDPTANGVINGYELHCWLVDSPDIGSSPQYELNPGDSLSFDMKLICNSPGDYSLPLHTTVLYGNGSGLFSTSEPITVTITAITDDLPPADIDDLTVE